MGLHSTPRAPIFLGDLAHALAELAPGDHATAKEIARLLGFAWQEAAPVQPPPPPPPPTTVAAPEGKHATSGFASSSSPVAPEPDVRLLRPVRNEPSQAPLWMSSLRALDAPDGAPREISLEPLFPPGKDRAILTALLAVLTPTDEIDVDRAVDLIANRRPFTRLPCVARPSLLRGAHVLLDTGPGMMPFTRDRDRIEARLDEVAGGEQLVVLRFEGCPSRGVLGAQDEQERPHRLPSPGTPVIVVSDLGIGAVGAARASEAEWQAYADASQHRGCPLIALVPYPPRRWPDALQRTIAIVEWESFTTARAVKRARRSRSRGAR